jgi:uncharacterized protein (DUF433 family)
MYRSPHTDRHPLIIFRAGGSGHRRPALIGSRLYVWQIVDTVRDNGYSTAAAAEYLALPEQHVQAAIDYYADFKDEVDGYRAEEREFERRDWLDRIDQRSGGEVGLARAAKDLAEEREGREPQLL